MAQDDIKSMREEQWILIILEVDFESQWYADGGVTVGRPKFA